MGEVNTSWTYSINYGPDGEENYANLVAPGGHYVSNIHTHDAVAISEGMNSLAAKDAEIARLRGALGRISEAENWQADIARDSLKEQSDA